MAAKDTPTQAEKVLDFIQRNGFITRYMAVYELGIFELAARIAELEERGYKFDKSGRAKFIAKDGTKGSCTVYKLVRHG